MADIQSTSKRFFTEMVTYFANKLPPPQSHLFNEWYLEDMSENIRSVLTNRRKNGFHIGSFALYGYRKDPDQKGHLLVDEEAAQVVRTIFSLFACGYGKTAIARLLNDQGIPNPTEYKRLHGLRYQQPNRKNSTLWSYSAISDMLRNEIYIGTMVQGRYGSISYKTRQNRPRAKNNWYIVANTHEPIIDRTLWEQVQTLLSQNARPFCTGKIGLFAGKTRCTKCGYTLRSTKSHGRYYLQCPTHHLAKDACEGCFISVEQLEWAVLSQLRHFCKTALNRQQLEEACPLPAVWEKEQRQLAALLESCQRELADCAECIQSMYQDKVHHILSESNFVALAQQLDEKRAKLLAQKETIEQQLSRLKKRVGEEQPSNSIWDRLQNIDHLTRDMVDALIDHITIGKRIPGTQNVPVDVYWKF